MHIFFSNLIKELFFNYGKFFFLFKTKFNFIPNEILATTYYY